jgi:hypothetical protein
MPYLLSKNSRNSEGENIFTISPFGPKGVSRPETRTFEVILFIHYQKPGPLGQVRDNGLCLENNTKCGVN